MTVWLRAKRGVALAKFGFYTLGSAVAAVSEDNQLALVRELGRHEWVLPGGFLRKDETPHEAAEHRFLEKTSYKVSIEHDHPSVLFDHALRHLHFLWHVSMPQTVNLRPNRRRISAAGWHPLDRLPTSLLEGVSQQLRALSIPHDIGPQ